MVKVERDKCGMATSSCCFKNIHLRRQGPSLSIIGGAERAIEAGSDSNHGHALGLEELRIENLDLSQIN